MTWMNFAQAAKHIQEDRKANSQTGMVWLLTGPYMNPERLGFIPSFLNEDDPRPAAAQVHENYLHGGGWRPQSGFSLDLETLALSYSDDPVLLPLAITQLRDELIIFYHYEWLLIFDMCDKSFEIARVN